MKKAFYVLLVMGLVVFAGCPTDDGGSSPNSGTTQDLNGTTWTASFTTSGITITYTLVFQQTTYTWTSVNSGDSASTMINSGTYTVSGNNVNVTRTNPDTFEMVGTLNGITLTLEGEVYTKGAN